MAAWQQQDLHSQHGDRCGSCNSTALLVAAPGRLAISPGGIPPAPSSAAALPLEQHPGLLLQQLRPAAGGDGLWHTHKVLHHPVLQVVDVLQCREPLQRVAHHLQRQVGRQQPHLRGSRGTWLGSPDLAACVRDTDFTNGTALQRQ